MVNTLIMLVALMPSITEQPTTMGPRVQTQQETKLVSSPIDAKKGMSMDEVVEMEPGVLDSYTENKLMFLTVYAEQFFYVTYYFDQSGGLQSVTYYSGDLVDSRKRHYGMYQDLILHTRKVVGEEEDSRGMSPIHGSMGHDIQTMGLEKAMLIANHWAAWNTDGGVLAAYFRQGLYTMIEVTFTPA
jgi:hypothetical protein